jgi:hypothetical protein
MVYREEPKLNSPDKERIWNSFDGGSEEPAFRVDPEGGVSRFFRKFSSDIPDYMTSFLRRPANFNFSKGQVILT